MAKLTLDGVTITKVTLDGIELSTFSLDGTTIYTSGGGFILTNIHVNTIMTGGANNDAPTNFVNVWTGGVGELEYAFIDGKNQYSINQFNASTQVGFEYVMQNGTGNHPALVVGETYRYSMDFYQIIAPAGVFGLDLSRGGLTGATLGTAAGTLVQETWTELSQEFTVTNATYLVRARMGIGLGGVATGQMSMRNPRLVHVGEVAPVTMTHTLAVWHGTNSAGMDASVPGGSVTPTAVAAGEADITRITSIAGGAPILHLAGIQDVGARITVTFSGGISFTGIGENYQGTHTRFVGASDGDALYTYLAANEFGSVEITVLFEANGTFTPDPAPSGAIHTLPTIDYTTGQGAFLMHIDHTSDANDTSYISAEFETRYDEDWSTLTNVSIESGRLKCIVDAGTYKKGIQSGGNLATNYNELYMTYEFEFATGFDFVLGGKLPGLSGRPGMTGAHADGCNPQGQDGGFSARMMFRPDGQLEGYFYHEDQPGSCGHQVDFEDGGVPFKVLTGTKYLMEIHVTMNTPGNRDGIVECKINGVLVLRKANFRFSNSGAHGINHKFIQMWHGGNSSSWAPAVNSTFFMNHFTVSQFPLVY